MVCHSAIPDGSAIYGIYIGRNAVHITFYFKIQLSVFPIHLEWVRGYIWAADRRWPLPFFQFDDILEAWKHLWCAIRCGGTLWNIQDRGFCWRTLKRQIFNFFFSPFSSRRRSNRAWIENLEIFILSKCTFADKAHSCWNVDCFQRSPLKCMLFDTGDCRWNIYFF